MGPEHPPQVDALLADMHGAVGDVRPGRSREFDERADWAHISSWVSGSPPNSRPSGSAERRDRGHLVVGELEAEDVEVLPLALGAGRLRDRQRAELDVPAQDHLPGGDAVPLGRPRATGGSSNGACRLPIGLHASVRMPSSLVHLAHLLLREARVQLDLVDRRGHAGVVDDPARGAPR